MNQFLDRVAQGAKELTKSAQKQLEIATLRSKAAAIRRSTGKNYRVVGELTFLAIQSGEVNAIPERVADLVETIRNKLAQAEELEKKALALSNEKICPQCHKASPEPAQFCQSCGTKFDASAEEEQEEEGPEATYKCPGCSTAQPQGTEYCTECGSKIGH